MPTPRRLAMLRWYGQWERAFVEGFPKKFEDIIHHWLRGQRWFLDKDEVRSELELARAKAVKAGEELVWFLVVNVRVASQIVHQYQLPFVLVQGAEWPAGVIARLEGNETGWLVDAWSWPRFAEQVLGWLARAGEQNPVPEGFLVWSDAKLDPGVKATPIETGQSNSVIHFGERYFLKVYRAIAVGVQPDEEMGRFLHRQRFPNIIPILAGLELASSPGTASLAVCSALVANRGTAWNWMTERLGAGAEGKDSDDALALLGQRTAELHLALAEPSEDEAFAPEPFSLELLHGLQSRIQRKAEQVLGLLKSSRRKLRAYQHLVEPILKKRNQLLESITAWKPAYIGGMVTRIHGDYHLGQVLRTPQDDWLIIDFEGEPLRTLAQRRAKDLPLRDVAGMRRSFAYVRAVVRGGDARGGEGEKGRGGEVDEAEAFTRSYFETIGDQPVLPVSKLDRESLLELYELEKVLYEIEYELRSRPEWVWIPLEGLGGMIE